MPSTFSNDLPLSVQSIQSVADTTVLNNFAQIRRPDLLRSAYSGLASPLAVWSELERGVQRGLVPACDWSWLEIFDLTEQEQAQADEVGRELGAGESACIAVAISRGLVMLSDDWDARALGRSLGIEVSGSLGVLNRLLSNQLLSLESADLLLDRMVRRGFRSPFRSLREIHG
jgi:predicted nucleic acid-binding protein